SLLTGGTFTGGPDDGYGGEYQTPGPGAFPLDTLVLPYGIKPSDLSYRVFQDPDNPALQTLQLMYGTSSVVINFAAPPSIAAVPRDPVNWWNVGHPELTTPASIGVDLFRFSDGTVLTRDQLIAQATLLPNDFHPVVREANLSLLQAGEHVAASTLFTV